jgi:hypothetical protein
LYRPFENHSGERSDGQARELARNTLKAANTHKHHGKKAMTSILKGVVSYS